MLYWSAMIGNFWQSEKRRRRIAQVHRELKQNVEWHARGYLVLSGIVKPEHDIFGSALSIRHDDALDGGSDGQDVDLHVVCVAQDVGDVTRHVVGLRVGALDRRRPTMQGCWGRSWGCSMGVGQALQQAPWVISRRCFLYR